MVASGKCDFNPGVADSDQLSDLSCTSSFLSDGAAAVFGAAAGTLVFSDAAALLLVGPVLCLRSFSMGLVLWLWSFLMLLSPTLMGLVLWCYLPSSPSLPSPA
jgi:hypothetical protein